MSEEKKLQESEVKDTMNDTEEKTHELSPTWAHDVIEDLDDWIESQGIYLRQ